MGGGVLAFAIILVSMEESQPVVTQVSVLIVSHNSIAALRRCLTALEASKGRETMEILVMDNGSRDGSSTIDSEFTHITHCACRAISAGPRR